MRVLILVRPDFFNLTGGDVIQVYKTFEKIDKFSLDYKISDSFSRQKEDLNQYDLVHFFHLPAINIKTINEIASYGIPIILSPIYWDITKYWFEDAVDNLLKWKTIRNLLGENVSRRLYKLWHISKRRRSIIWNDRRSILEIATLLLPNSGIELKHLAKTFNLPLSYISQKSVIVPNGVSPEMFENTDLAAYQFIQETGIKDYILEVGRIERSKGQIKLIQTMRDNDYPLIFIGQKSPYESEYVSKFDEISGMRGNVFFINHLPQDKLIGAYAAASVHALPSWRETPGLVSLEAAAAGCKIVSTNEGSAYEYFHDMAWYCNPIDPESIKKAINYAINSKTVPNLRDHVLTNFTWQKAAEKTFYAYQLVLGGHRPG